MLFVITTCITVFIVWLSVSECLATTTSISWRWLDAPLADIGLPELNTTSTEMGDTFFQAVVIPAEPSALMFTRTTLIPKASSSSFSNPQSLLSKSHFQQRRPWTMWSRWFLFIPSRRSLLPVSPELALAIGRLGLIAPVSLFAIAIAYLVGFAMGVFARSVSLSTGRDNLSTLFVEVCGPSETIASCAIDSVVSSTVEADSRGQINEVVVEDIPVPEKAKYGEHLEATDNIASITSGYVSSSDAVQPLRTSVGVQFTSDVCEVKNVSVGNGASLKDVGWHSVFNGDG
ncbi:hypothetical protein IW262DRAFT_1469246 [Armillaria fumosa]|nr:hypothetical protein IW262DRAFT_1469246 [Armillaria fumosa]